MTAVTGASAVGSHVVIVGVTLASGRPAVTRLVTARVHTALIYRYNPASYRPTLTHTWSQHRFTSIFSNKTTPNECDVIFMLTINNSNTFLFLRSESEL